MTTISTSDAADYIGREVGASGWLRIDQDRIDTFAKATNDRQYIHVDPVAAAATPFGSTIAHGFLTLSLLTDLVVTHGVQISESKTLINYGMNKVRFLAPVKVNDEISARAVLLNFEEKRPNQFLMTLEVEVKIRGEDKLALIAEWLSLIMTA